MIRDVNAVTADLERAFVCAEIGLDLEHVRQVARDAVDSGRHYRDVWLSEGDVKQSRLANQLVDVGETLSEIVGMRQRARLNNRLDAQIRLATANGLKLKVATNGRVY